jgi:ketosteroid isomerase-like protein
VSANLDLVRSIYAAIGRGDFGAVEWSDPEIEFVYADGPDPTHGTGLRRMADSWREQLRPWEEWRVEADEYRELDNGRILVLAHFSGRGKTSGLEIEQMRTQGASLFQVRDGKVVKLVTYWDRARALADLGLED